MRNSALALLLALPAAASEPAAAPKPRVAVVIDDFGFDTKRTPPDAQWLALPFPVSYAVMPASPRTKQAAKAVREAGRELLIHYPFDPFQSLALPERSVDPADLAKVKKLLDEAFRDIPGAAGLNNHISAKATANRPLMKAFMPLIKGRVGFFLDSRTNAKTVAYEEAKAAGIPAAIEYIFLDTEKPGDREDCVRYLRRAAARARKAGDAVAIGHHYHDGTLACLREEVPRLQEQGIEFVPVSSLAR
jgi:polysaccharide deacetylase 2 family uncharacterized protein YibQ